MINLWIDADDLRSAEKLAIEQLRLESWIPTRFDHWHLVDRNANLDEEQRISVEEAFQDGLSCTFYTWPPFVAPPNVEAEFPPHRQHYTKSVLLRNLATSVEDLPVELSIRERGPDVYGLYVSLRDKCHRFSERLPVLTAGMFEACEGGCSTIEGLITEFARDVKENKLTRRIDLSHEEFDRLIAEFLDSLQP